MTTRADGAIHEYLSWRRRETFQNLGKEDRNVADSSNVAGHDWGL
jgi:hypothetical protein